jgi:hypothetical protein
MGPALGELECLIMLMNGLPWMMFTFVKRNDF